LSAHVLAGPTGERNVYQVHPRSAVLCWALSESGLIKQLAAVLAVGSRAVWNADDPTAAALFRRLPAAVQACVTLSVQWQVEDYDAALHEGDRASLLALQHTLAQREGAIVPLTTLLAEDAVVPLERLVIERALSIDTTAAGGNASLMTMS